MGLRYGTGYCVFTDLHFRVRAAMGIHESADNYLQLLCRTLTGYDPAPSLVRQVAALVFGVSVVASIALNVRDRTAVQPVRG
jgi:hypothetical protein